MKRFVSIFLFFIILGTGISSTSAQDYGAEIQSLRQQIAALRGGSIQSNDGAAQAVNALQELQLQFESVKGSIDSNTHVIQSATEGMNLKLRDMEARIAALEERLAIQGKQVTSAVSTVAPEAAAEGALYQAGLKQINSSEFLKAIATFKKFKKKFPKSEYTASAQYWVGECYFAMRDYEQAIREFQDVIEGYPRSDKIPAALLKQGYSFIEIDMESDAKSFFNHLIRKYPRSKEAKEAKERMARDKKLKAQAKKSGPPSAVPLAPGVVVPDKNSNEKYR